MSDAAAVVSGPAGRLGVLVQTRRSLHVYWRLRERPEMLAVRVQDLSGRPAADALDGSGVREVPAPEGEESIYLTGLLPGRPYAVELCAGGEVLLAAPAVQTPNLPHAGDGGLDFPAPYHRS